MMDVRDSPLILPATPPPEGQGGVSIPRTRVDLPWPTVGKAILILVAATFVGHLLGVLRPIFLQLLIALLITAALTPPVAWLVRRGVPRPGAVAIMLGGMGGTVILILALIIPRLTSEGRALAFALPGYVERAQGVLKDYPSINKRIQSEATTGSTNPSSLLPYAWQAGTGIFTLLTDAIAIFAMSAYLLAGGERSLSYVMHYLPVGFQAKIRRAVPDVIHVVSGYVLGQVITSAAFGLFAFVVLYLAHVPQPLLLALLAAILDAVPIIGVLVATVLAVALALTVSETTAIVVLVLYLAYHQLESHVLVPRIYGRTLGISSLAVLVAVLIGYRVLGIIGVLIALPLAAAEPAFERAWRQEELLVGTGVHHPPENHDSA
jgi:predicted PurR-regulated permease PerM